MAFAGSTTGTVIWFNTTKKFGKVVSPDGEIFLPPDVSTPFAETLVDGAKVSLNYVTGDKGKAASHISSVEAPQLESREFVGRVKWYDPERGEGSVSVKNEQFDIRIAVDNIDLSDIVGIATGQNLTFMAEGHGTSWNVTEIISADDISVVVGWHISKITHVINSGSIGFLRSPRGASVALRLDVAKEGGLAGLFKGLELGYKYILDPKYGLQVTEICDPADLPQSQEDKAMAAE